MKHYLVYHSVEKMGHSFREAAGSKGESGIVTRKNVSGLPDRVVWLIPGEGKPSDYRLKYWASIVSGTERLEGDDTFANRAFGTSGASFDGGVHLNGLVWFREFRESQSNFSLGLQAIPEGHVRHLMRPLARSAGRRRRRTLPSHRTPRPRAPRRPAVVERIAPGHGRHRRSEASARPPLPVCGTRLQTPLLPAPTPRGHTSRRSARRTTGRTLTANAPCLCPNHHVLLDAGAFSQAMTSPSSGWPGTSAWHPATLVEPAHLAYHRRLHSYEDEPTPMRPILIALLLSAVGLLREGAATPRVPEAEVVRQRRETDEAVAAYVPAVAGDINDLSCPAADILSRLPGVVEVEVLVAAPRPTHRLVHVRDWHYVPA